MATLAMERQTWSPFVDNLFSVVELAAKALLLSVPDEKLLNRANHRMAHRKCNLYANLGNVSDDHRSALNSLRRLRPKGRYLKGDLDRTVDEARTLLDIVGDFINWVDEQRS